MPDLETFYGNISTPDWKGDLIKRSLDQHGEWAFVEQQLLASVLQSGDRFWDGGALFGTFGLGVAQIAAQADKMPEFLLAIEPGADLHSHVRSNLERNSPCPFDFAPYAITQEACQLQMQEVPDIDLNHGARSYELLSHDTSHHTAVDGLPLWMLREEYGNYDCLKLDIEGMELAALLGDMDYLQNLRPAIWAECNEDLASLKLLEAMVFAGYEPVYVAFPAFRSNNYKKSSELIYPMVYEAALLGASQDRMVQFQTAVQTIGAELIVHQVRSSWDLRKALWTTPRWTMPEWADMNQVELIALLGRYERKEDLRLFLNEIAE